MRFLALTVGALVLISASANAQQVAGTAAKGPTIQAAAIGIHVSNSRVDGKTKVTTDHLARLHEGQDVALMAVGLGAMIVGALVGETAGTIIIIGGAAVALYGLYHYLE